MTRIPRIEVQTAYVSHERRYPDRISTRAYKSVHTRRQRRRRPDEIPNEASNFSILPLIFDSSHLFLRLDAPLR